ncbi:amino acid adenylation domain-containing protein [Streptomyces chattanoogensis]|uniref:Amino acid adenylation protein n=1 Tax=Streptomyces chattanoogensis TaxID=66876 RepID=A0A0N1JX42_9ACTN|nr:amino acid adenylation domain-containing protein [Streptomyces chattanoogensis]KPC62533.1 amino acid adenylation protein [Streptomyces chattanoogensis]
MKTAPFGARIRHTHLGSSLPGLLKEQAEAQPEAMVAACGDQSLTYRELVQAGSRLAACLQRLGVGADDSVGLYVEPSLDLMAGAWGILFAGAAYLPLSPEYPEDRLRYMIEDSRTRVIVTQDHLAARLAELVPRGTRIVTLAEAEARREEPGTEMSPTVPRPDDLAYVIYTSGSTGRPKGVMIEHRSIMSQMRWMHACGHLGKGTTVLQKTPMSFDAAQWEILAPAVGGRVVVGAPGIYRDPQALIQTLVKHEVTTLQCVPTLLQALLDNEEFSLCTSLRRVFSGGEALSRQLARTFADELPWVSLVNLYGPTECTINATAYLVDPDEIGEGAGTIPIGVPVDNTQCFILDKDLAPVDIGETGELYIGGVQLARGYLHRPEQTRERFVPSPFVPTERLYRTGDLAYWNPDGTIQFSGRTDNQIKLRGYRVELDEIALAIEEHTWVKRAAALVTDDARTGFQNLVACVELNPKEAALMDQGNHGGHHQSKATKLQVKAQLSNPGVRDPEELHARPVVELPGKQETQRQRRETFARKTYRFYEGGQVTRADVLELLAPRTVSSFSCGLDEVTFAELGEILRWFGQYRSAERLLPKYAYASPGALYATQMYLEAGGAGGVAGLDAGVYYYHPVDHTLVRIGDAADPSGTSFAVHFVGKKRAIEPVYKNNIQEVLEFETGHMVGLFEEVLPEYGLNIRPLAYRPSVKNGLDVADEDYYLGTFEIHPSDGMPPQDPTEIFVQAHPGGVADLTAGQYCHVRGDLVRISDDLVLRKHVIAINQKVYDRAGFGITAVSRADQEWLEYISLGTKLHHLQRNGLGLGFMSSGYSSRTGHPLPAARRMDDILAACGIGSGASYFFLGGKVSEEQIRSEGMHEDAVHMKGPAEMIKDELAHLLPDYMIPNRVLVLDELPLTANGKIDGKALAASDAVRSADTAAPYVAPATRTECWLAEEWGKALKYENVSVEDEFFASGGNSLTAVALINKINKEFGTQLPLQVVFECPKLADLAARIGSDGSEPSSRLVLLDNEGADSPVFCWPGLGGYPMNLRLLGREAGIGRPFYGIQAHGINAGETPYPTIREMAAADVAEIRRVQPRGPYTLWGYSFGARVAFEAAWQLEQAGEQVANLLLLCPGNPKVREADGDRHGRAASYRNPAYVTILFSVFAGTISGPELDQCLEVTRDEDSFLAFVHSVSPALDEQLIRRITRIVAETYEFEYTFRELAERRLNAPVAIFKAAGDDYSFIEGRSGYSATPPAVVDLDGDHYSVLKEQGVAELVSAIRSHLGTRHSPSFR